MIIKFESDADAWLTFSVICAIFIVMALISSAGGHREAPVPAPAPIIHPAPPIVVGTCPGGLLATLPPS